MPDIQVCVDAIEKCSVQDSPEEIAVALNNESSVPNGDSSKDDLTNGLPKVTESQLEEDEGTGLSENDGEGSNGSKPDLDLERKTNLIINYLPATYADVDLLALFNRMGEITDAKVARDRQTGLSYGFGFVNFAKPEDATTAIAMLNGFEVQNKRIKVSYARPPGENRRQTNLYIQNLPKTLTDAEFVKLFEPFGSIIQSNLLRDRNTGLPRGAGFVRYDTKQEAEFAIKEMNKTQLEGSALPLVVKVAEEDRKAKVSYYAGIQMGMQVPPAPPVQTYLLDYNLYGSYNGYYQGPSFIAPHIRPRYPASTNGRGRGGQGPRAPNRRPVR